MSEPAPAIPPILRHTIGAVVPQWPKRLRERWLEAFVTMWPTDIVGEERLARLLTVALRRGWFDAADAGRWPIFVAMLRRAARVTKGGVTPTVAVNLFNLTAALPSPDHGVLDRMDDTSWSALAQPTLPPLGGDDLAVILERVMANAPRSAGPRRGAISPMLRVTNGVAVDRRGERWLETHLVGAALEAVFVLEPFGINPWEGVSEVGLLGESLVAWSRPLGLVAHLVPDAFPIKVERGEPGRLRRPKSCDWVGVGLIDAFESGGYVVGRSFGGEVVFAKVGEPQTPKSPEA